VLLLPQELNQQCVAHLTDSTQQGKFDPSSINTSAFFGSRFSVIEQRVSLRLSG
jgi:hypothetical protein